MILTPVSLLNMNQKKNSTPQQISKPNPPTPEMIERAQFKGQDVQMEREVNLIFDIETDGLLENVTTIHCLVIHDLETKTTYSYNDTGNQEPVSRGIQRLNDADSIIGHNIVGYDLPVIDKLFPWFVRPYVVDTLLLSRLYHADMMKLDKKSQLEGEQCLYNCTVVTSVLNPTGTDSMNLKVTLAKIRIGKSGLKKWKTTVSRTYYSPQSYGNTSNPT